MQQPGALQILPALVAQQKQYTPFNLAGWQFLIWAINPAFDLNPAPLRRRGELDPKIRSFFILAVSELTRVHPKLSLAGEDTSQGVNSQPFYFGCMCVNNGVYIIVAFFS